MATQKLSNTALRRLIAEERRIKAEGSELGFFARPSTNPTTNEKDYSIWNVYIKGTVGSTYENHVLHAKMTFPYEYPIQPPKFIFVNDMFHPNIYNDGKVCISILHVAGDDPTSHESPDEKWTPVQGIRTITLSVISLLNEPNPNSPANVDASKALNTNKAEYENQVIKLMQKVSLKRYDVHPDYTNEIEKPYLDELYNF